MKAKSSSRHLFFAAVAVFVFSNVGYADPLTISIPAPGVNTFVFVNAHPTATATDFRVVLASVPPPGIGNGSGGTPFPVTTLQLPATGGGFLRVIYDGGPGIPAGGTYSHSFPGWPVGTSFNVTFSYLIGGQIVLMDPTVREVNSSTGQGATSPSPEPTALLLLGTGLMGFAMTARKRFRKRN
jgi:hypothetical protein